MEPIAIPTADLVGKRIFDSLVEFGAEPGQLRPEATLEELDIDSLDLFELGQILHQEFGLEVDPTDFENVQTLGDAQRAIMAYVK
jgi:acyl carrier protein